MTTPTPTHTCQAAPWRDPSLDVGQPCHVCGQPVQAPTQAAPMTAQAILDPARCGKADCGHRLGVHQPNRQAAQRRRRQGLAPSGRRRCWSQGCVCRDFRAMTQADARARIRVLAAACDDIWSQGMGPGLAARERVRTALARELADLRALVAR